MTQALFKGGSRILFLGVETYGWTDQQFTQAAEFAKAHGFTGVALKCADRGDVWYGGYAGVAAKVSLIEKVLPCLLYTYAYADYVPGETAILAQLLKTYGGAICDMEVEFNGNTAAAQAFEQAMRPVPGILYCTTWADPVQQNWVGVINVLAPCINGWIPQEYNNFLEQAADSQYGPGLTIYPAIDLTQEFGANDPVQIAKDSLARGEVALFVWEYAPATQNTGLVDQITAAFTPGGTPVETTEQKLVALENAYNKVVAEKNGLVAEIAQLKQQLAQIRVPAIVKSDIVTIEIALGKLKQDAGL